ncbi:hypothetical protein AAFF_G00161210 [Aldrovandia affinis]|uniref:PDZ domain-containing protein n=1 Tax=Aldrovandia affinis TaxID=143900 RepID=A0AAD7RN87_9TELE|nr:hypothetical protein AAFF_G00161210 [Aldrovandia affinis]
MSSLHWVSGKEQLHGGLRLFPVNDSVRGRCISPEKEAEEIEAQIDEDVAGPSSEPESISRKLRHHWDGRRLQKHRALHGQPSHPPECTGASENQGQHGTTDWETRQKSLTSQVPLKLQIKVCGHRGSLGISIAGGKGSLPYKERDEGVFISRVAKGGPAEKAGIHIGDRVLEVNGMDMQEVTHHEAVSTLRNAGSCVRMKMLRERSVSLAPPPGPSLHPPLRAVPLGPEMDILTERQRGNAIGPGRSGPRRQNSEPVLNCRLPGEIEAIVVCNGNSASWADPEKVVGWPARDTEACSKANAFQVVKNTMAIPRIILTHPSTSDEDIEPLTQDPDDDDFGDVESHAYSDCLNNAFYPP